MRLEENTPKVLYVKLQSSQRIIRGISDAVGPGQFQHIADLVQPILQQNLLMYDFTEADAIAWQAANGSPKYEQMIVEVIASVLQQLAMQSQQAKTKRVKPKC